MTSLGDDVREYTEHLRRGAIQRAYRGILAFMSDLRAQLERRYPDYAVSAVYPGYLDMTYFAFTPPALRDAKLKVAIVYLHAEDRLELWLGASNRRLQADIAQRMVGKDLGGYSLVPSGPGVDAIIADIAVGHPDFDSLEQLRTLIESKALAFADDMARLIEQGAG